MNFLTIKQAVHAQFTKMLATGNVFTTSVSKDELKKTYLANGTAQGVNDIFRERGALDCNCCNDFIRVAGGTVAFIDGKLVTIWDISIGGPYQAIADAMAKLVRANEVNGIFLYFQKNVGADKTPDNYSDVIWDHFFMQLPAQFVKPIDAIATLKSKASNNYNVLKRSLTEITVNSIETVQELIDAKSIYKGVEYRNRVSQLAHLKATYDLRKDDVDAREEFLWRNSTSLGDSSNFRSGPIGELLTALSNGTELERAVGAYEQMTAPENYKRSSALTTPAMTKRAVDRIIELEREDSLERRHAVTEDITINDVLFADRSVTAALGGILSKIKPTASVEVKEGTGVDISIEDFLSTVVPKITSMELLVTGEHQANFMSLVAPTNAGCLPITKWDNNYSWSYHGEIADSSMRKNVKAEGGNVDGVFGYSIQWNTPDRPYCHDLDAHCRNNNEHIYYRNADEVHPSSGMLDVDIQSPGSRVAVENIVFTDLDKMPDTTYELSVHNFTNRTNSHGFTAEVYFEGKTFCFDHTASMRGNQTVPVATFCKKDGKFTLVSGNPVSETSVEVYGIKSKEFHKVSLLMNSPNYWDCVANPKGNKHWFFILENCINEEPVRGLYNEFLLDALQPDRKVFETLGAQLKVPFSENQLSGLGFSETQNNTVVVKVSGEINRLFNVKFNQ